MRLPPRMLSRWVPPRRGCRVRVGKCDAIGYCEYAGRLFGAARIFLPTRNCEEIAQMNSLPACPACQSAYTYEDGHLLVCPECGHEWSSEDAAQNAGPQYKDANGNVLSDGDSVSVIKDLKVKGSSAVVKVGTKVKNIRLVDADHNIDCKIDGIGAMKLKSEFVKKI